MSQSWLVGLRSTLSLSRSLSRTSLWGGYKGIGREVQELTWTACTKKREMVHVLCVKWYLFQYAWKAVFDGKLSFPGQYKIPVEEEK